MIVVFVFIVAALSCAYLLVSQYNGSAAVFVCYPAAVVFVCALYFLLERRRRMKLIRRAAALFNGEYNGAADEDELSALERTVVRSRRNAEAREAKVTESYKSIAALVSDISHQCKTPLTSVLMYSELSPSEQNSAAVRTQAEKLSFLLDALTKLSRCEGGLIHENLRPAENSIVALMVGAVNAVIAAASAKNIEICTDLPDNISARFDMRWTGEALFNLLDNAVKYTQEGGRISISACEYDMFVRVDVTDSGVGIAESEQTNIWKRFYRADNASDVNGVGIGLYLTRLIITGEGGRVSVKSEKGKGSTFSVFLPRL